MAAFSLLPYFNTYRNPTKILASYQNLTTILLKFGKNFFGIKVNRPKSSPCATIKLSKLNHFWHLLPPQEKGPG